MARSSVFPSAYEKVEKMHFSVVIVSYDMEIQLTSVTLNLRCQGHSVTFFKGHLGGIF